VVRLGAGKMTQKGIKKPVFMRFWSFPGFSRGEKGEASLPVKI
jgi:hypothetical protein